MTAEPDQPTFLPLDVLRLDDRNPRLPTEMVGTSQAELAICIERAYSAISIARSIAEHGYFPSEPLIAMESEEESGIYIVLEGNRRLVSLLGLRDGELRTKFDRRAEWDELASLAALPDRYPVLVVDSRREAAPVIGFRHISGIEPWDPLAKSRFIASLIDDKESPSTFEEVADLVGEGVSAVRSHYRNFHIVEQARDAGLDVEGAQESFGVLTRAMQTQSIRAFLTAPAPAEVEPGVSPIPEAEMAKLSEVFAWLFGTSDGDPPVISDSRELTKLGETLNSADGVEVLRTTHSLEVAHEAAGGPRLRLMSRLTQARNALRAAQQDISSFANDDEVRALLHECADIIDQLRDTADADQAD